MWAVSLPPLFRRTDWLTFFVTFAAVWVGFYLTLAPEVTLEDSGELATGSFYAGIPHPPGYPVWTVYTWLWTVLVPFKNVAWRVALGEATSGALAAALLGLLVSRGSSQLVEGIEDLKALAGRWESAICVVAGFVAGTLLGFNGFMWSQSVIVEVYAFSVANFMLVLLCLLRWIYAPHQRRYLYLALFLHGLCFTNHQTLIVAAIGIEVAIAAADFRLGRYLWLGNSIVFVAGLFLSRQHVLTTLDANPAVFVIFNVVGVASILAYVGFTLLSKETLRELFLDICMAAAFLLLSRSVGAGPLMGGICLFLSLVALVGWLKFAWDTRSLGLEWLVVVVCGICWILGAAFYFYMPLAGMTNPPMEWGYPRTVEGFFHVLTRGQYERTNPTDIIHHPLIFAQQLLGLGSGIIEEFNWVYAFLALVPFLFFFKLHKRERAWLVGLTAIYLCLGVLLLILLNPPPDRQSQELNRVFFTSSHTIVSLLVGYGLTLISAYMATHYQRFRSWGLLGGAIAVVLALYSFYTLTADTFFGEGAMVDLSEFLKFVASTFTNGAQYGVPVYAGLILIGMTLVFLAALLAYRSRAPLAIALALFALMPLHSVMTHWADNEERNHWFGYWFGHDMFTPPFKGADGKPIYPPMTKDAILFGGTDPGRFCPTYMIFCDSFIPHPCQPAEDRTFDRRDVYIITQNALADGTYLCYIRAQFNRSTQIDPPFFQELVRSESERQQNFQTNLLARALRPLDEYFTALGERIEKRRRTCTSWFTETDFINLPGLSARLRTGADPLSKYLYDNCSPATQQFLSEKADDQRLRRNLSADLNRLLERELEVKKTIVAKKKELEPLALDITVGSATPAERQRHGQLSAELESLSKIGPLFTPERFRQVHLSEYITDFIKENPQGHTRIRLNRLLLEEAYPGLLAKSLGGVYPDREIYTPTPEDSQRCLQEYLTDAERRLQLNQLKPMEDVRVAPDGKVQVSGQVAVMSINGLLTRLIFDRNPKNEFFVEESFPLDWMYPYLTPFGIIMKINRQPLAELSEDVLRQDHSFWSNYSERLVGNWVTYDTPVKQICDWVEKVYLRRDFTGFTGDRKFIRDDQAQKAFSKLRSSIAGIYAWRFNDPNNHSPAVQQRMLKEAEFAFRQAFALCPYSPEAVFRYCNLLMSLRRFDEALLLASTCKRLDPNNGQVVDLVKHLQEWRKESAGNGPAQGLAKLKKIVDDNPSNFQAAFDLASSYLQVRMDTQAVEILERVSNLAQNDPAALRALLQAFSSINSSQGLRTTVDKLEALAGSTGGNFQAALGVAEGYRYLGDTNTALKTLDGILSNPRVDVNTVLQVAQQYSTLLDYEKLEQALEKYASLAPSYPEAWYDLSAIKAVLDKPAEAIPALRRALELNAQRLKQDPKARDLLAEARKDQRFGALRESAEFKKLVAPR